MTRVESYTVFYQTTQSLANGGGVNIEFDTELLWPPGAYLNGGQDARPGFTPSPAPFGLGRGRFVAVQLGQGESFGDGGPVSAGIGGNLDAMKAVPGSYGVHDGLRIPP